MRTAACVYLGYTAPQGPRRARMTAFGAEHESVIVGQILFQSILPALPAARSERKVKFMPKPDRTVVRNKPYTKKAIGIRERHNERKNESYSNPDVIPERSGNNVYFKKCEGTYAQAFDRLVQDKVVSTRGLRQDANVFDEMVFDVNTAYFERHGGYAYAVRFYREAYKLAAEIAGGEQYIISAVMHADERNRSLSAEYGYDVYHYHLHVVYIPVVEKDIRWTKRCRDKALIGKVKEVVHQVSHSKKWGSRKMTDERGNTIRDGKGKPRLVHPYSLLQDRFYEHMRDAGYTDFERGVRGSTAEHLSVLDYKLRQEQEKVREMERKARMRQQELDRIEQVLEPKREVYKTFYELEHTGKKKIFGKVELTGEEFEGMLTLAKEGIVSRSTIPELKRELAEKEWKLRDLRGDFDRLWESTRDFFRAVKIAPKRVKELLEDIFAKDRAERERERQMRRESRSRNNAPIR